MSSPISFLQSYFSLPAAFQSYLYLTFKLISYIFAEVHYFIGFNKTVFGVFYNGFLPLMVLIPIILKTEEMPLNFNGGNTCLLYDDM
jgi:hypothetical protein